MKKLTLFLLSICVSFSSLIGEEITRTLVVKPVFTTRSAGVEDNWGGVIGVVDKDPRYEMAKVEGSDNLYSCNMVLNKYFKTNKWATKWGNTVQFLDDGVTPNEGWSNNHQFVVVYQDEYGDQENKNNPNAAAGAQAFLINADNTEVTFYAVVEADGKIRSYCDAQSPTITIQNNTAGNITLPAAIGQTFTRGSIQIDGSGKIETVLNNHVLNPINTTAKYTVSSRGNHSIGINFHAITYFVEKIIDKIQNPQIQINTQTPVKVTESVLDAGLFSPEKPLLFTAIIDGVSETTSPFKTGDVAVAVYYKIMAAGETTAAESKVDMVTEFQGEQLLATWKNNAVNLTEGLADGAYTLIYRFEALSHGEQFALDNDGSGYSLTFSMINDVDNSVLLESLNVSSGTLFPAFEPLTKNYTVQVGNKTTTVNFTATAADTESTVSGTGAKQLAVGDNEVTITVTAKNGSSETYRITVTRHEGELSLAPLFSAPRPTYPMSDVMSFFSSAYPDQTELRLDFNWGQAATAEFITVEEDTKVLKLSNMGWFPLGLQSQKDFLADKPYLHLDIYAPEGGTLCVGFQYYGHSGTNEAREIYGPDLKDLPAGEWYSIDIPVDIYFEKGYDRNTVNVLRFRGNAGEIYISNMYTFTGEPKNLYVVPDADATLKSITLSVGELTPGFEPSVMDYVADLPESVTSIVIQAETSSNVATLSGDGEKQLLSGTNVFYLDVTAESGDKLTYKLIINRGEATGESDLVIKPLWADDANWSSSDYRSNSNYVMTNDLATGIYTATLKLNRAYNPSLPHVDNTKYYYFVVDRNTDTGSIKSGNPRVFEVPADATSVTFYAKKDNRGIRFVNDAQEMMAWIFANGSNEGYMVTDFSSAAGKGKASATLELAFDTQIKFQVKAKKEPEPEDWIETDIWEDFYSPDQSALNDGKITIPAGTYNLAAYYNALEVFIQDPNPDETSIGKVFSDDDVRITAENGTIQAAFEKQAVIELYTVTGLLIDKKTATDKYVQQVGKGMYVLIINGKSYKIMMP